MPTPNRMILSMSNGIWLPPAIRNAMEPVICTAKLPQATRRRSAPTGINQPTSVRPAIAAIVAALIAMPAN